MIRFKWVKISNFMSFGQKEVFVDLDTKNTRAIMGRNEDIGETGSSANGVGKTTIFNAIIFALYGKGIDKLKTDEYINIVNGKKLVVELCFQKGEKTYIVRRGRKPNFLDITEDETSLTLDAMRNTDEAITALLGYGYDLFMSSFFLSPHRQSFMAMSGPEQRSMIENMLSLDVLAERAISLKSIRDEIVVDKKVLDRDLIRYEQSNKHVTESHESLMRNSKKFEEDRSERVKSLQYHLNSLKEIDLIELREIFDEYLEKKDHLRELEVKKREKGDALKTAKDRRAVAEKNLAEYISLLENLERFEKESKESSKDAREYIDSRDAIETYEAKLAESVEAAELYNKTTKELKEKLTELSYVQKDLKTLSEKKTRLETEISGHESGTCHVCGGDYVDEDHLERSKKTLGNVLSEIATKEKEEDSLKERVEYLQTALEGVSEPDQEAIAELSETCATLKECLRVVSTSDSIENPYSKLIEARRWPTEQDIEELSEKVATIQSDYDKTSEELSDTKTEVEGYEGILSELRVSKKEHIDAIQQDIDKTEREIEDVKNSKNAFLEEATRVLEGYVDLAEMNDEAKELDEKEKHVGYLIKLLTDSKSFIRRRILDNYVPYLNKKINEYSEKLGLPHVCEVDSDLSVSLTYMSRGVSYYNLSRGERLRLDMATTGAFRDVMALLGKGCNLSLLDEVLDSALDASGIHSAMNFIGSNAETVLLVTHREELSSGIGDKIVVVKRNGFSDIE